MHVEFVSYFDSEPFTLFTQGSLDIGDFCWAQSPVGVHIGSIEELLQGGDQL